MSGLGQHRAMILFGVLIRSKLCMSMDTKKLLEFILGANHHIKRSSMKLNCYIGMPNNHLSFARHLKHLNQM
jgi:hypothetical protein